MAGSLTAPLSNQDADRAFAGVADAILGAATLLRQTCDFWYAAITPDNLAAGMLLHLGGPDAQPWTQEEYDRYLLFVGQTNDILQILTTGSPPPTGIVQPWSDQFRQ